VYSIFGNSCGFFDRFFARAVNQVHHGHPGVAQQHARASIPHYLADTLAHFGFVTVHRAPGAGRFAFLVWAAFQALIGVILQHLAGIA
jgi:hypothetical protein